MGADNWDPCPRCVDRAQVAYEERVRIHHSNYGVIPAEVWLDDIRIASQINPYTGEEIVEGITEFFFDQNFYVRGE